MPAGSIGRLSQIPRDNEPRFDVIVIGGGITGVCIAREASANGMSVVLVDKADFGSGTSSATTKYIHGGIRYLESMEVGVVRESLRERRILALAAPHLVRQQRFLMPAWSWSKPNAPIIGLGVGLYGGLAYDRNKDVPGSLRIPRSAWLSRSTVLREVPWLQGEELRGAWAYYDTLNLFPERLLLEFLFTAVQQGALAINYCKATRLDFEPTDAEGNTAVSGIIVQDTLTGEEATIRGSVVVNAAGPWVDEVLTGIKSSVHVLRSKGVHVLVSSIDGMRQQDAVFARARTGGHVIVSPWMGRLLVGPTDTAIDEQVDDAHALASDVALVLDTLNQTLADGVAPLTASDVIDTTVGVRPLIGTGESESYSASRRHEVHDHASEGYRGLYSILGGKWTTGRATAEHLLRVLASSGHWSGHSLVSTRRSAVSTAWAWADDPTPYVEGVVQSWARLGIPRPVVEMLTMLYGTAANDVLALAAADPALAVRISDREGVHDIAAQIAWGVDHEGARTLADLIDRRMTIGSMGGITDEEILTIAQWAGPLLDVDPAAAARSEIARRNALRALWESPSSTT
ncbi:MAG: glycerol-3-phosphate dehydrogenase/oxidase [Actinomycetes bacterium]